MALSKTFMPSSSSDVVQHLADDSRDLINQVAASAGPVLDSVREKADDTIGSIASQAAKLQKLERRMLLNVSDQVRAHPVIALGIAVAAGWLITKALRSE